MPISVTYASTITTVETLATNVGHQAIDKSVTAQLSTTLAAQTSGSTPSCVQRAGADVAMTAGALSLDLTALLGTNGATVVGSGRVQMVKFFNPATNANAITIAKGASNGYDGFGSSFSITLAPGAEVLLRTLGNGSVIGSTNRILDVTGTLTQVLSYEIIIG